ncbi:UTP--glucose-1-phosphate uridylyltransferase 1, partial [Striga hermonthica]
GKEYILMLSDDNLAQVIDPKILNHLIRNKIEFCLEVRSKSSDLEKSELPPNEDVSIPKPKENWKSIDM